MARAIPRPVGQVGKPVLRDAHWALGRQALASGPQSSFFFRFSVATMNVSPSSVDLNSVGRPVDPGRFKQIVIVSPSIL